MRRVELSGGVGIIRESGDPVDPDTTAETRSAVDAERGAVGWAKGRHAAERADAADETVQSIIADLQALKAEVKAAPVGPLTLTRAQTLKLIRAVLWHIKGDKTA